EWGEQAEQVREGDGEGGIGRGRARVALRAVGPSLHELQVVVAEGPEERLRHLEGTGVVVTLERPRRHADNVGQAIEHRLVEGFGNVALSPETRQHELRRVEDLD